MVHQPLQPRSDTHPSPLVIESRLTDYDQRTAAIDKPADQSDLLIGKALRVRKNQYPVLTQVAQAFIEDKVKRHRGFNDSLLDQHSTELHLRMVICQRSIGTKDGDVAGIFTAFVTLSMRSIEVDVLPGNGGERTRSDVANGVVESERFAQSEGIVLHISEQNIGICLRQFVASDSGHQAPVGLEARQISLFAPERLGELQQPRVIDSRGP